MMMMKSIYLRHLLIWTLPVIAGQWAIGWRMFRRNLRAIFLPALIAAAYFSAADNVAIRSGLWFFDPAQILGWHVGALPVEEVLFFLLTSLLVTQSYVLLLPRTERKE